MSRDGGCSCLTHLETSHALWAVLLLSGLLPLLLQHCCTSLDSTCFPNCPTPLNTQHSTLNTQHPTLNTQHPTPNTQHPTPNTQHPTSRSPPSLYLHSDRARARRATVGSEPILTERPTMHKTQETWVLQQRSGGSGWYSFGVHNQDTQTHTHTHTQTQTRTHTHTCTCADTHTHTHTHTRTETRTHTHARWCALFALHQTG